MNTLLARISSYAVSWRPGSPETLSSRPPGEVDVEVEIAAYAARNGSISEAAIEYHPRLGVQKLSPIRDGVQIMLTILRQWLKRPESKK